MDLSRKHHPEDPLYIEELLPFIIPNFEHYTDPMSLLG